MWKVFHVFVFPHTVMMSDRNSFLYPNCHPPLQPGLRTSWQATVPVRTGVERSMELLSAALVVGEMQNASLLLWLQS